MLRAKIVKKVGEMVDMADNSSDILVVSCQGEGSHLGYGLALAAFKLGDHR